MEDKGNPGQEQQGQNKKGQVVPSPSQGLLRVGDTDLQRGLG